MRKQGLKEDTRVLSGRARFQIQGAIQLDFKVHAHSTRLHLSKENTSMKIIKKFLKDLLNFFRFPMRNYFSATNTNDCINTLIYTIN